MPTTLAKERRYPAVRVEAGMTERGEEGDDGGLTVMILKEAETGDGGVGEKDEVDAG
jgi:hypothetical protein